jgi:hypothetical protein
VTRRRGSRGSSQYRRFAAGALQLLARERPFGPLAMEGNRFRCGSPKRRCWRPATDLEDLSPVDMGATPHSDHTRASGKSATGISQRLGIDMATARSPVELCGKVVRDCVSSIHAARQEPWERPQARAQTDSAIQVRIGPEGTGGVESRHSLKVQPLRVGVLPSGARS